MKRITELKRASFAGLLALLLGVVTTPSAFAGELALSNAPLFIELGVLPNVILTLDDSSSMSNCRITDDGLNRDALIDKDGDYGPTDYAYLGAAAPALNKLAYDPNVEYVVPTDPSTGLPLYTPSFTSAQVDGYFPSEGTINLSTSWRPCRGTDDWYDPFSPPDDGPGKPAYYTIFTGSDPFSESQVINNANYTVITVGSAADVSLFDGQLNESNLEKQNFANWFSFYRWRYLAMKTVAIRAFSHPDLNNRIRLAWSLMWGGEYRYCTTAGWPGNCGDQPYDQEHGGPITPMKRFGGADRIAFFTYMFASDYEGGTPLLMSMKRAGEYYRDKYPVYDTSSSTNPEGYDYEKYRWESMNPIDSPWSFQPGVKRDPVHSCRQAFHVLMTDGGWDDDDANVGIGDNLASISNANIDNQSWTYPVALPSGATSYSPIAPYKDSNTASGGGYEWGMLADNAFYYWVNDLQPTIPNDVPSYMPDPTPHPLTNKVEDNPRNDPATWQHMVTFTVGFGVDGDIPLNDANYQDLLDGSISWSSDKIDDLWHTAINSRAQFFNAKSPQEMVDGFATALSDVLARTASGSAVSLNSGELDTNARLYQALFNSGAWNGQLLSFKLDTVTGAVITPEVWDAAQLLTTQIAGTGWDSNRVVITHDGTAGIPFRWGSLSTSMKNELTAPIAGVKSSQGQARLQYLRGSEANEGVNGNGYRARATKLGDIVDSSPVYVGDPAFNHPDTLESQPYSSFRSSVSGRPAMIYVGANDGMLHGFDAVSGEERLAYVPREVFPNLPKLLVPAYAHTFYVNGAPTTGDVFFGGAWHTMLVGGLRKGGQAIYALDVTDPANFSEGNAASLALWEFNDANDADLGYTYSRPGVVRMKNGKWAAVFGNGYNNTVADGNASTTGNAVLYIVDIENGTLIKKIDTGVGRAQDPTASLTPNGLATVSPVDVDGDRIADYVYGGDLFGNLWKFDVNDADPANWAIAYGGSPLFVAMDGSGARQPITAQLEAGPHPSTKTGGAFNDGGYMVYFGTGKYLESSDNSVVGQQTQTFYGIWDPNLGSKPSYHSGGPRKKLLRQQITEENTVNVNGTTADVRVTTDNSISWPSDPLNPGSNHLGWYMDLLNTESGNTDNQGERQITTPILRGGRIIFTTLIPSGSSCVFGGDGWVMELDSSDGSRLVDAPFDIDGDGMFDLVTDSNGNLVAPGGLKSQVGAPQTPGILTTPGDVEYKYVGGTEGGTQVISEQAPKQPPGAGSRESWQQLR
jgi:type IV pilus assembly protein PilY1